MLRARTLAVALAATILVPLLAPGTAHAAKERPSGTVFLPNPVVALRDQSLTDDRDADSPAFAAAYSIVRLRNLDDSGYLRGAFASVCAPRGCAFSEDRQFHYDRSDFRFEQVMAYYAVTKAQRYLRKLGFDDVNAGQQEVLIRSGIDNSFYDPMKDQLVFGSGGVDDAEDMDVIWHEYGHAIQDAQVPGFGKGGDAAAIGEGFGDYWAFTMSEPVTPVDPACIADWDSVSYTTTVPHCLRRVDTDLTTADLTGEPHHDGQVWSRALYDIHRALGAETTDRIVITAQSSFAADATFSDAVAATRAAARALYGRPTARVVRAAFAARGIT
jgi:hypothetical protein